MSTRKIESWHAAGLIDAETRARLIAHEAEHARPLALWAVFGIGALAIGLGLVSVVAANWEDVPGQVRLAIHLALIAGMLGALFVRERAIAAASPWASEALVFIACVLGLTFFGHLGQVYQTSAPLWQPLAVWLALFGGLMLVAGRGWPVALLLVGGALYTVWEYNHAASGWAGGFFGSRDRAARPYVWIAIVTMLPVLLAPLAAFLRARSTRPEFWRRVEQLALAYAVLAGSASAAMASAGVFDDGEEVIGPASQMARAALVFAAGGLTALARPTISGRMAGAIIAGAGLAIALALAVNDADLAAALLFMALWLGIAAAALKAGWRGVFQLAVAAIALRLIVLSFELASDLLLSGFGLIVAGLLILAIAYAAFRVSREFAPKSGEA
jgi:uncharacterized membrane protein